MGEGDVFALSDVAGGLQVEADNDTTFAFTLTYMATDHVGIELLGSAPFEHNIDAIGSLSSALGTVGETNHLPPTLMAQYYFRPHAKVRPYVGAGLNYTIFFDEDLNVPGLDLDLDNSLGLAFQAGVDIDITDRVFLNGSVWYMNIDTDATIDSAADQAKFEVSIDPVVLFAGIGYRF